MAVLAFHVIHHFTGFFAQARSLRLADGPDEVHKGMIAKLELAKRGYSSRRKK